MAHFVARGRGLVLFLLPIDIYPAIGISRPVYQLGKTCTPANREVHNPQTPTDTCIIVAMPQDNNETLGKTTISLGLKTCVQDTGLKRVFKTPPGTKVIRFYSYGRSFPNDIHSICQGSCTPEARYNSHVL